MRELLYRFSLAWLLTLFVLALNVIIFNDPYEETEGILAIFVNAAAITAVSYVFEYYDDWRYRR
ncbi:hypothetical protein [Macrococcus capreoli]|uniref:hypothetical protein n=1 Tax=Macrococcus capreoli TaxID=2982690 RepID=UPI0021D59C66|nr:hypothetical protein [Macrococcus sp. TMW 2.2395]MCU7556560.1 hypothetical protein [Macrococcus sp. TMW 2.2395]